MHLSDIEPGVMVRVVAFDGSPSLQNRLLQHGLYPGDQARILRRAPLSGPLLVDVAGREIALGRAVAEKIVVEML